MFVTVDMLQDELERLKVRYVDLSINYHHWRERADYLRDELERVEALIPEKRERPDSVDRSGYVYLLKVINTDNLYKIGRTRNPKNRLATFDVKLPFPVEYEHVIQTDNMYKLERQLHARFAHNRQNGSEFFTLHPDDVIYVKGL